MYWLLYSFTSSQEIFNLVNIENTNVKVIEVMVHELSFSIQLYRTGLVNVIKLY